MKNNGALYWWIANVQDRHDKSKPQTNVEFLQKHLPRARAKLGEAAAVIVCNPVDRDALDALQEYVIETSETILPGNFWIGARNGNGAGNTSKDDEGGNHVHSGNASKT